MTEPVKYDVEFEILFPGDQKPRLVKIVKDADDESDAISFAKVDMTAAVAKPLSIKVKEHKDEPVAATRKAGAVESTKTQ